MSNRYRGFVFTHNNYTDADIDNYTSMECKYIVAAREVGANGNPHLQGYIEYKDACTKATAIRRLRPAHVEIRLGTAEQADKYCRKGEQSHEEWEEQGKDGPNYGRNVSIAVESGKIGPGQGKRSDLEAIAERVRGGASSSSIAEEFPEDYMRFHRGINALISKTMKPRDPAQPPYIEWRWGLAGRGKTHHVFERHGVSDVYVKPHGKWWQHYTQQPAILMDDFDATGMSQGDFKELLRLLDIYPYMGEVKSEDSVHINSPYIYITCEHPPSHYWSGNDLEQLASRLDAIVHVQGENRRAAKKQRVIQ